MFAVVLAAALAAFVPAQDHDHHHHGTDQAAGDGDEEPVERPRVFLDKPERIVWFQLDRLSNDRLLLVERATTDVMYAPVYEAILKRPGMSRQHREEALQGLVALRESDDVIELLGVLDGLTAETGGERRVGRQLAAMLLSRDAEMLRRRVELLGESAANGGDLLRPAAMAAWIAAGAGEAAWGTAMISPERSLDYLAAVSLLPSRSMRAAERERVVELVSQEHPPAVRRAAVSTLADIPVEQDQDFLLVADLVRDERLRTSAVRTLLAVPQELRDRQEARQLVDFLVDLAEATPAAERTTTEFVDAMQLTDQLLTLIPVDEARAYRARLREVTVRVIRIKTVEEEMRYDTAFFVVEAGRPVQVILQNEDLMPHNLVITNPGKLVEVAEEGARVGPQGGLDGKQYVPPSEDVLFATPMVEARSQTRLTFTAPSASGEYPYVCTFPRHWMRMYGVMLVVPDLDAWAQDPVEPEDPLGNTRTLVQNWTVEDLEGQLESGLRGRTPEIGERIFVEATCAQCHKMAGQGGAVGPELTGILERWKGDRLGILREILDPSHKVDSEFAVSIVVTLDGEVVSGIVKEEDDESITLVTNPEDPQPRTLPRDDIDEIIRSDQSMMPKALLDRFTQDEIFELLAYVLQES